MTPPTGRRLVTAIAAVLIGTRVLAASSPGPERQAPGQASPEYMIKAAYLLNFARLIEWPPQAFAAAEAPITVGVVGADPFGQALELTFQGKTVNRRPIAVQRLQWSQDLRRCHILFVSQTDSGRLGELSNRVAGLPVLVVSEATQAAARGATINFRIEDDRVRFDVNVDAAKRAQLTVSSQILRVATIVRDR
ncbi:MAG TPA: YfiR family protein [Vicinamibacterales bacterium]|nr:YfiR family protein [Vicinamibacterales bacterium]